MIKMMNNTADQALVFALCLDNDGYPASLEVGKLYRVISGFAHYSIIPAFQNSVMPYKQDVWSLHFRTD
jgi:hypothetical protein